MVSIAVSVPELTLPVPMLPLAVPAAVVVSVLSQPPSWPPAKSNSVAVSEATSACQRGTC